MGLVSADEWEDRVAYAARTRSCPGCGSVGAPRDGCRHLWHVETRAVVPPTRPAVPLPLPVRRVRLADPIRIPAGESTRLVDLTGPDEALLVVPTAITAQLRAVAAEWRRTERLFGPDQAHPDNPELPEHVASSLQNVVSTAVSVIRDVITALPPDQRPWWGILLEEVFEALDARAWPARRAELTQVAAVCLAWLRDGDRREAP